MEQKTYEWIPVEKEPESGTYLGKYGANGTPFPVIYGRTINGEKRWVSLAGKTEITHYAYLKEQRRK